ncbi:hypothetical protein DITRI_Ditri19aG0194200 [Diplodiscus trichospermus]
MEKCKYGMDTKVEEQKENRMRWEKVLDCIPNLASKEDNEQLIKEVNDMEIEKVVYQFGALKTP